MSIEKRDGKYVARWRDPDGRQRAKRFATKREATDHMAIVTADQIRGTYSSRRLAPALKTVAAEWTASGVNLSPITVRMYREALDGYILPTFGDVRADRITAGAIQQWIGDELERLAPSTVHRHYRSLRTLLGFAVKMGYVPANVCDQVTAPKVPRSEVQALTVEQVAAIADAIGDRYRAMVLVTAYAGLRWGEVIGLRRCDVDGARITVAGQLQKIDRQWQRLEPKWASRRTVVLPESIAAELAAHMARFTGPGPDDLVFTNAHGNPIGNSFRFNVWGPACVRAGLGTETWTRSDERSARGRYEYKRRTTGTPRFHDLRHTAAAFAIATGAHPKAIQSRLGHSSISMTMDLYGHLMAGMDESIAAGLDTLRGGTISEP